MYISRPRNVIVQKAKSHKFNAVGQTPALPEDTMVDLAQVPAATLADTERRTPFVATR